MDIEEGRMGVLWIEVQDVDGQTVRKTIVTDEITAVTSTKMYKSVAAVHHGENRERSVYLNAAETRMMIGKTWHPSRCPAWTNNRCWGARQHEAPSSPHLDCVGCQLRQVLMRATGEDLRLVYTRQPSPLKAAVVTGGAMLTLALLLSGANKTWLTETTRRIYEENLQLRAQLERTRINLDQANMRLVKYAPREPIFKHRSRSKRLASGGGT